jgi:DNA-binding response OmpR family regulator
MPQTILVVEDNTKMVNLLRLYLEREGFDVVATYDGRAALEAVERTRPSLIVLDLMLPHVDGIEICRQVRAGSDVPILMLTARVDEVDKLLGLSLGADDYVTKPFSPRELVARVRAILRRAGTATAPGATGPLRSGDLALNPATHEVALNDRPVDLTAKEFELLKLLLGHPNRVFTRDFLLEHIWGYDYYGSTRTVDMHISRLREKIEDDPAAPTFIVTVRGVGYKFKGTETGSGKRGAGNTGSRN